MTNPEAHLIDARTELIEAMKKYLKATWLFENRPTLERVDIDKFVFISTASYGKANMYHVANSGDLPSHELIGLVEMLRERTQ